MLEEELPVLEIDENRVDTRLRLYPHITAIYNVGTDSYWYYDSHWGTYHFTLNRALTPWDLPKYPKVSTPTHSRGLGMMYDPEYDEDEDFERYYGREAQKRDEAYSDYVDFLDGF